MAEVWIMGEMLVEVMRTMKDVDLYQADLFKGPYPSGAPAIFIDTVARLGHSAGIIGGVGKDDFGKCLLDRLKGDGVDCSKVIESQENSTGVAFVTYFSDGSRKFLYHIGNTPAVEVKAPNVEQMKDTKYFHVMGCSLMADADFAQEILKTMHGLKDQGTKISFDPNIRRELLRDQSVFEVVNEVVQNSSVFLPGVEELLFITGRDTIKEAVEKCFENSVLEILALKNGSKGCTIYTRTEIFEMGVYPVDAVDVTGAGDSFDGAFICGLLEGKDIEDTAKMAAAAGALNTAAFGPMEGKITVHTVKDMIEKNKK
ncbi:MAG: PfkB domain protein [Clostridia bacterium]|jgi:sugar/nucleoside kinase (ribokinase family)|nr:PfkB domain protein [Clostridia bacterium]